jgi:hypothetical protein
VSHRVAEPRWIAAGVQRIHKLANLGAAEAQRFDPLDEPQPAEYVISVEEELTFPLGRAQHSLCLVEAQGGDPNPGQAGNLPDVQTSIQPPDTTGSEPFRV